MRKIIAILFLTTLTILSFAQTKKDKVKAYNNAIEAIKLMDNGEIDKSIKLLKESCKLDPEDINYPYEIGYAYVLKEDYSKSIEYFEKVVEMKGANDQSFQMLGNVYDMNGQPKKAIATYNLGLEKFPKSGRLYLELGVMYHENDWDKALEFHEKGIEVAPSYPSNYYWASRIFCSSTEEIWGILYGEIFMNIERGSKRTEEISKLLFDTYFSEIKFQTDTSFSVSFCQNNIVDFENKKPKIPYGAAIFEPSIMFSCIGEDTITIESLNRIRHKFITFYSDNNFNKMYPNILFDWHKTVIDSEYFECYNYWLFMQNSNEFNDWHLKNNERFNEFINWFSDNPMQIDKKHSFHRKDY